MFDDQPDGKHGKNTASLPMLTSILSRADVLAELQARTRTARAPNGQLLSQLKAQDPSFLQKLQDDAVKSSREDTSIIFDLLQQSQKLQGSHLVARLRSIRHELFAHTAIERSQNNKARYGDAEELLTKTKTLVSGFNARVRRIDNDYSGVVSTWEEHADLFWRRATNKE